MEVKISFRSEIYIEGKSLKEIKETFEALPLFSVEAIDKNSIDYVDLISVEQTDDNSYKDLTSEYKNI